MTPSMRTWLIPRTWRAIGQLGVNPLDRSGARSIEAGNQFFVLASLACLPWVFVIFVADPPLTIAPALTQVALCAVWLVCLDLNRRRFYTAAAVVALLAPVVQFTYLTVMFSMRSGFQLSLLVVGALAFVILAPRRWMLAVLVTAVATGAVAWTYLGYTVREPVAQVTENWMQISALGNIVMVVVNVSLLAAFNNFYFLRERRRNQQLLDEAEIAAKTDALTGLFNRRGIAPLINAAVRAPHHAIALADIDRFKRINDRLGHGAGDVVLAHVGETLSETVGDRGVIARWGGEEFLVVMPNTSLDEALALMERARKDMESEFGAEGLLERVTMSFGVAHAQRGVGKEQSLRAADDFLYEAKASGRNIVVGGEVRSPVQPPVATEVSQKPRPTA